MTELQLDDFHAASADLARISRRLSSLARCFGETGNNQVAEELGEIARGVKDAKEILSDFNHQQIARGFHQAQQNSDNLMLMAAAVLSHGGRDR